MNKLRLLGVIVLLGVVGSAYANKNSVTPVYSPPQNNWNLHLGFYIEAGVGGNAFYAFLPDSRSTAKMLGWGVPVAVGYDFLQHVAAEAGFIYSTDLNAAVQGTAIGITASASAAAKLYIPYMAIRFSVPVGQRINVIFKLGGMYPYGTVKLEGGVGGITATGRISGEQLLPFSGIGATYAVLPKLDINIMYQGAVYVLASGAVLSVGVTYHFE